ncbi:GNAT family N-acetyltransferase [Paraburkholderia phenazinium]|jgi:GNAT superfamily N-acetyltransferase|uniref:Protein N-acetyltransferase, RimJ/RimL family n=1 Tax=Paraburkholderia phenazinium TaxID=60549 RepID=A0A1G8KDW3_9BURK|nr:GNAT family N-acetyltransferase [Paraburkholderia phenazinium]SDI41614.1 Protein N-acetyltransferase, RimJ/RimL family [Paraburkholderia phenazinium]
MKTNLEIITREATAGDLGGISEVFLRARKELMPFAPLAHSDYAVCRWIADWLIPTGGVSVATDAQGLILGMMATSEADGVLWLDQLYVSPPWVGHGIGARLLALVISNTRLPVHLHCFAENARARQFYERHGFVAIAFGDGSDNEEGCPDVVYALQPAPQIDGCESS